MCIFDLTTDSYTVHYFVNNPHIHMSTIQTAVIEQIQGKIAEKQIPITWLLSKVGVRQGGRTKKRSLSKQELVQAIEDRLHAFIDIDLHNMTTKEVLGVINGEADNKLLEAVTGIPLKVDVEAKTTEELTTQFNEAVAKLEMVQLWKLLEEVSKYEPETTKAVSKKKSAKGGYVSVPDDVAKSLIATYYNSLASGSSVCTPECFRGGRVANGAHAFRRFIFSHVCKDECSVFNSMPTVAYEWYKENNTDVVPTDKADEIIEAYHKSNPDYLSKVKSWKTEKYVTAVVKK